MLGENNSTIKPKHHKTITPSQRHIAIVANTTWNIYNFRLNVIRKLRDEGCRITVIAPVDEYVRYREDFPELDHLGLHHLDRDGINPLKDLRLLTELLQIYQQIKPDLVIHYTVKPNIYGGFAAGWAGVPSMAVVTGLGYPFIHNGFVRKVAMNLYRQSNRFHKKVIFENDEDWALFVDANLVSKSKSGSIIGCGVDTSYFNPKVVEKDKHKTIFTFIGRLLYDKGVREFVAAAKQVRSLYPDTQFWLLGELDKGNPSAIRESDLMEWVQDPNIYYLGSKKDVRKTITKSDCIVLPSYREGFSRVLMEAMAMSKPVITSDTPGCREAVEQDITGFLVPVGDEKVLAENFIKFLNLDEDQRSNMGEQARAKAVAEFDDKIIADKMFSIIQEVMK